MNKLKLVVILAILCCTQVQASEGGGFYLGGSVGQSETDIISGTTGTAKFDDGDTGFKIFGGFEINEIFSVEGQYANFGEASLKGNNGDTFTDDDGVWTINVNNFRATYEGTSYGLSVIGKVPIPGFVKPFGRVGFHIWDVDVSASSPLGKGTASEDGTDIFFGGGIEATVFDDWLIRAEYERYDFDGDDVDFISIGFARFLR